MSDGKKFFPIMGEHDSEELSRTIRELRLPIFDSVDIDPAGYADLEVRTLALDVLHDDSAQRRRLESLSRMIDEGEVRIPDPERISDRALRSYSNEEAIRESLRGRGISEDAIRESYSPPTGRIERQASKSTNFGLPSSFTAPAPLPSVPLARKPFETDEELRDRTRLSKPRASSRSTREGLIGAILDRVPEIYSVEIAEKPNVPGAIFVAVYGANKTFVSEELVQKARMIVEDMGPAGVVVRVRSGLDQVFSERPHGVHDCAECGASIFVAPKALPRQPAQRKTYVRDFLDEKATHYGSCGRLCVGGFIPSEIRKMHKGRGRKVCKGRHCGRCANLRAKS